MQAGKTGVCMQLRLDIWAVKICLSRTVVCYALGNGPHHCCVIVAQEGDGNCISVVP